jgi:hypothetical protein
MSLYLSNKTKRDMRRVLEVPIPPPEVPKDVALPEVR